MIATAAAFDQTPTLQHLKPTYDRSAGHAHVGGNLSDRKRLALEVANSHASGDEESFYAGAEGLASRGVIAMYGSQQINTRRQSTILCGPFLISRRRSWVNFALPHSQCDCHLLHNNMITVHQ